MTAFNVCDGAYIAYGTAYACGDPFSIGDCGAGAYIL